MSRKNVVFVVLAVVSLLSLALTACVDDDNSCTPKPGEANCVSQGKPVDTPIQPTAVPVKVQVQKTVDTAKQAVNDGVKEFASPDNNNPLAPVADAGKAASDLAEFCKTHASAVQCP